ncbi:glutaminase A [Sphingomonas sp. BGYR3]|uniref:glutaminase A n=1 Tax=Sphingomonas sp. BGYR3 TaxID=2975483 RepID=UPI0021A7C4A4|nr:glutaminase A [Sphingomonas sp. BGYR3]MDG5489734.1 glutaminase A [Sphingomonas sp. BGYR3]
MQIEPILADIIAEIQRDAAIIEAAADRKDVEAQPGPIGIAVAMDGAILTAGAFDQPFPIQSISKVFALDLALQRCGDAVFKRVGREPSGDPFNSVIDLERTGGIPRNPFINAGALVVCDMLAADAGDGNPVEMLVRDAVGDLAVDLNQDVLTSDGDLNRAMLSFMKHHDNIEQPIDRVLDLYARQCALTLDCRGLAAAGRFLTHTRLPRDGDHALARARQNRTVLALMMTCGHYDGSGDFAVRVGLPAKSGVGGGILAIAPEIASIAVWSPNLDQHGNSILGVRALEMLGHRTGWSVFGPPRD